MYQQQHQLEYRFNIFPTFHSTFVSNGIKGTTKAIYFPLLCPKGEKSKNLIRQLPSNEQRRMRGKKVVDFLVRHENLFKFFIIYILTSLRRPLFPKYNITNWIIHMRGRTEFEKASGSEEFRKKR